VQLKKESRMKKNMCVAAAGLAMASVAVFGAGDAAKGKDVFEQNCSVCHNADSTEAKVGPGLKGLFKKDTLVNKQKVTETNVRDFINKGSENGMPSFADILSDQEKADLIEYLKTL
jgi:cytochrome c